MNNANVRWKVLERVYLLECKAAALEENAVDFVCPTLVFNDSVRCRRTKATLNKFLQTCVQSPSEQTTVS